MPGFLSPRSTDTYYIQEFNWTRSPQVWKTLLRIFLIGFIAGCISVIYLYSHGHDSKAEKAPVPCKTSQNK